MDERLKIPFPVIVEGRYDKLRLESVIEGQILVTDGFGVFNKTEKGMLFRALAQKTPLIVLTDSMYPDIKSGDLIICKTVDVETIEVDDVISFYDPAGNGVSVVTHKVIEIVTEDGQLAFRTKGINNNTEDRLLVPADKVIAEYTGVRIPGAGNVAIFMQSTAGLIVCVVLPIVLFVGYDVIRRKMYEKNKGDDMEELKRELEALKAAAAQKETQNAEGRMQNEESAERRAERNTERNAECAEGEGTSDETKSD